MKPLHTPGPWRVGFANGSNVNTVTHGDDVAIATVYGVPLHCRIDELKDSKWKVGLADARLIAAAPDLLAAIRIELAALIEQRETGTTILSRDARIERLQAAIDKARLP